NGVLDPGEECDDNNTEDGDGCTASCTIGECGLTWTWTEDVASSIAGGFDVAVGDDGSVYVAGRLINADNDTWVAKWNPDGSQAWSVTNDFGGNDTAAAIAVGAGGEVYVIGWFDGFGDDIWYAALDPADGETVWSTTLDGNDGVGDGDDLGSGIALTPDGDLVLAGRIRVGDGDDDVWVRKVTTEGTVIWTSTWSGTGDNSFSTDRSGSVAVGSDGSVWVTAREHVDFDTQEATLLHFDEDGNFVALHQPQAGGSHQHDPIDVLVDGDSVYFAFAKSAFPYRGWLYKLDTDGTEQWLKTEADWVLIDGEDMIGEDWTIRGLGLDGNGNLGVAGVFINEEQGEGIDWGEAWVAKLDGAGEIICRGRHAVDDGNVIPPSLSIDGAGFGAGGFGLTGIETAGQGNATKLWTARFNP
ncbi:MAG TPA: hypothetical protein VK034_07190, partial [Enhygromyxa sp.]|nr:hypothetical protein [Enhygromyxa sp.]